VTDIIENDGHMPVITRNKNSNTQLSDPETRILFMVLRRRMLLMLLCIGNLMVKN